MAYVRIGTITAINRRHLLDKVASLPEGYDIKAGPKGRSLAQNDLLHKLCGEIARQVPYMGKMRTGVQWKALLISAHATATGLPAEIVPGLEGEWVNIRESSASMSVARMTSLIEYIHAWAAENNVQFNDNY